MYSADLQSNNDEIISDKLLEGRVFKTTLKSNLKALINRQFR